MRNAEPDGALCPGLGDLLAGKRDTAAPGRQQTGDRGQQGRFTSAISSYQGHYLTAQHLQRDIPQHLAIAVTGGQVAHGEYWRLRRRWGWVDGAEGQCHSVCILMHSHDIVPAITAGTPLLPAPPVCAGRISTVRQPGPLGPSVRPAAPGAVWRSALQDRLQ